jgi:hypothetical protein
VDPRHPASKSTAPSVFAAEHFEGYPLNEWSIVLEAFIFITIIEGRLRKALLFDKVHLPAADFGLLS